MSAINAFNWLYCHFLAGFTLKKKKINEDLFKAFLLNQANFTMSVRTSCFWGEKSLTAVLSPACSRRDSRSSPTSYTTKTCLGPHWEHTWDTDTAKAFWSFHTGMNCSSITQTLQLFFCCPSLRIPISLVSAAVILMWCFLGSSSWLDTVVWIILEFLLGSHFIFSWCIPHVLLYLTLWTKFLDFQAEGVMSRGVK